MVDPGVVLEKIIVNTGGLKAQGLGPPESYYAKQDAKAKYYFEHEMEIKLLKSCR